MSLLAQPVTQADIRRFTYHPATGDQEERYQRIRSGGLSLHVLLKDLVPECDELRFALHYVDLAVLMANAGVARHTTLALSDDVQRADDIAEGVWGAHESEPGRFPGEDPLPDPSPAEACA